jgi:signal transduction histidine kinase
MAAETIASADKPTVPAQTGPEAVASLKSPWFYALTLTALALGVAIGLYTLRYHQRMMHSYEEVESIAAERNRALDLAQADLFHSQKMRALGTLATGIAHDFNNLLSIIRMGNNFLLRRDICAEEKAESGQAVERAVDQGKNIVRSMLGYSREPAGADESYSVPDLVNEAGLLLNQQFLSGITLTLELNSQLPLVTGRRSRMQQILLNLLVNATEAMNGHGRLRIAASATNSPRGEFVLRPGPAARYIELVIEDTGPGIDPHIRDRVFEPFFSTKPRGASSGTGLGLSLVHSLAEQEKIGISLESVFGRGTKFTLWIPVADVPEELVAEPTLTAGGEPGTEARL